MRSLNKNMQIPVWIVLSVLIFSAFAYFYFAQSRTILSPTVLETFADLGNTLYMNQSMDPFDALTSPNILYKLVYQDDGNLAIVKVSTGKELWSSHIKEKDVRPGKATMHHDGNLILYDASGKLYWSTGSNRKGSAPFRLELQNDGIAAIFDSKNDKIWVSEEKK